MWPRLGSKGAEDVVKSSMLAIECWGEREDVKKTPTCFLVVRRFWEGEFGTREMDKVSSFGILKVTWIAKFSLGQRLCGISSVPEPISCSIHLLVIACKNGVSANINLASPRKKFSLGSLVVFRRSVSCERSNFGISVGIKAPGPTSWAWP